MRRPRRWSYHLLDDEPWELFQLRLPVIRVNVADEIAVTDQVRFAFGVALGLPVILDVDDPQEDLPKPSPLFDLPRILDVD